MPTQILGVPNKGKKFDLSANGTFKIADGNALVINCTADATIAHTGTYPNGFLLNILNTGTHTISLAGDQDIGSQQRKQFNYDDDSNSFIGG